MKNRDIYISALSLIGESVDIEENNDYEERAPYLLAAFCSEAASTDAAYREMKKNAVITQLDNNRTHKPVGIAPLSIIVKKVLGVTTFSKLLKQF